MTVRRLLLLVTTMSLATGCARGPGFLRPAPVRDWKSTLEAARAAADSGKWATADRRLAEFAARHPEVDEAHEALYWRALFRMAPGNDSTAHRLVVPTLQRYLARRSGAFRTEARVLLQLAEAHAELAAQAAAKEAEIAEVRAALGRARERPAGSGEPADAPSDRTIAAEVERLRGELAKANQELERIRRRLAGQRP